MNRGWCLKPTTLAARDVLIFEGDRTGQTCLILDGWACRFKGLAGGERQIVGLLMPGDSCDLHGFLMPVADHGIAILTDAVVALIPPERMLASCRRSPTLERALWTSALVEAATAREWLINIGRRSAAQQLAALFCELWLRGRRVGLTGDGGLAMPLTQNDLGDATALTSVHVNRTLKVLREMDLITLRLKRLFVPDIDALMDFADYDPAYLQLRRRD